MKRILLLISVLFLLLPCLSISACAEEECRATEAVPPEYTDFLESIPEELRELLPASLFSNDCKTLEDATRSMSHFSYLLRLSLSILGRSLLRKIESNKQNLLYFHRFLLLLLVVML